MQVYIYCMAPISSEIEIYNLMFSLYLATEFPKGDLIYSSIMLIQSILLKFFSISDC